jgi:formylglycine-generating enzyme required for sulfatase activity
LNVRDIQQVQNVVVGAQINELPPSVLALFAEAFGFDPGTSDADALEAYFEHVILERHSKLSFLFIRPETGRVYTEGDVELETVFVPLRLTDPEALSRQRRAARRLERFGGMRGLEEPPQPLTLAEVIQKYPCFLLRGKPGSGKTTLLRHIALAFARGEQAEKLGWEGPPMLPLLVPLRNFGTFLKRRAAEYVGPQPRALLDYLEDYLRGAGVRFAPEFLRGRLDAGQCFLLLDALDEASGTLDGDADLRAEVARQVSAFIRRYARCGNRFALTSRPHAFQDDGALRQALPQPRACDVFDLDTEGYTRLINNLLGVLTGDAITGAFEAKDLCARIAQNLHLVDLAGNPLLCTTLVLVYKYRGRKLPERRVDVLHEIVTLLLGRWEEERRDVASPGELARMGTNAATTEQAILFRRRALMALAWEMQEAHLAEIPARQAVEILSAFYCDEERTDPVTAERWAKGFLDVAHERSGLFIAVDEGLHAFAHQAFREYLAATQLVNAGEGVLIKETLARAPEPDEWWEQVLLLASAHPQLGDSAAGRWVQALLARDTVEDAYFAARGAQDMTDKLPGVSRKPLQDWLWLAMRDPGRPPRERARVGDGLVLASDPRFRADAWYLPDEPLLGFVKIPAGPFVMGSDPKQDEQAYDDERPQHERSLPTYYVMRYPVTVAQFRAFVRDSEYGQHDERALEGTATHPVVHVTWYDAMAYCRWLTERLRKWEGTPEPLVTLLREERWAVTLPSEAQWEKAARGEDGRIYPWGNGADPNRANYGETGIGSTSAVGCFPGGASPYEIEELNGNVVEWTRTGWQEDYREYQLDLEARDRAVVRGGAFYDNEGSVRCAYRRGRDPYRRGNHLGFRVVCGAPIPRDSDASDL